MGRKWGGSGEEVDESGPYRHVGAGVNAGGVLAGICKGVAQCAAMTKATSTILGSAALCVAVACGGGTPAAEVKKEAAPAEPKKAPEDDGVAKRKAEREAKEAAKIAAEKKKAEVVGEITKLPEGKLPKKIDKACEALTASFGGFMKKHYPAVGEDKLTTQRADMKKTCLGMKIEVAACQANAFTLATGMPTEEVKDQVNAIMGGCLEKFGAK